MMDWMFVSLYVQVLLPFAEAVEAVVCMVSDFQVFLIAT